MLRKERGPATVQTAVRGRDVVTDSSRHTVLLLMSARFHWDFSFFLFQAQYQFIYGAYLHLLDALLGR